MIAEVNGRWTECEKYRFHNVVEVVGKMYAEVLVGNVCRVTEGKLRMTEEKRESNLHSETVGRRSI